MIIRMLTVGHPTYPTRVQVHRSRLAVVRPGSCTSGTDRQLTVTLISTIFTQYLVSPVWMIRRGDDNWPCVRDIS